MDIFQRKINKDAYFHFFFFLLCFAILCFTGKSLSQCCCTYAAWPWGRNEVIFNGTNSNSYRHSWVCNYAFDFCCLHMAPVIQPLCRFIGYPRASTPQPIMGLNRCVTLGISHSTTLSGPTPTAPISSPFLFGGSTSTIIIQYKTRCRCPATV